MLLSSINPHEPEKRIAWKPETFAYDNGATHQTSLS
jgi:hypothetical protein